MTKLDVMVADPQLTNNNNNNNSNMGKERDKERASECQSGGRTSSGGCAGKYLLRPRSVRSLRRCDNDWSITEPTTNSSSSSSKRQKSRPAPLSKYRRKTANTRERCRMRQINTAFEKLRKMLPALNSSRGASTSGPDMTKITTLKYACAYIRSLQDILDSSVTLEHRLQEGDDDDDDGSLMVQDEDECSWVFSSCILDNNNTSMQDTTSRQDTCVLPAQDRSSSLVVDVRGTERDSDFMDLLCDSSDSGIFDEDLNSFSYVSPPLCEADEVALLLLSAETSYWHQDPSSHLHFTS
ncbi:hypothetical protein Pmani_003992 [Petrolisthes manimaculis]|uniref:BHLH domain-containing protein n=1 Tax=Petrolisthes manimaculis TaxID=1843537 RepID=A0AAE1QFR4_9EUCA|nr:hypothetical protein Pmani_003992 [Petrolisthes manimaculis]